MNKQRNRNEVERNTVKGVDFSYPSSPNAERAGMSRTGCYTVSLHDDNGCRAVAHYADKADAFAHAAKMPQRWGAAWLRYCAGDIAAAEAAK